MNTFCNPNPKDHKAVPVRAAQMVILLSVATACSTTAPDPKLSTQNCPEGSSPTLCMNGTQKSTQAGPKRKKDPLLKSAQKTTHEKPPAPGAFPAQGMHQGTVEQLDPANAADCALKPAPAFPEQFEAVQVIEFSRGPEAARQRNWVLATLKRRPSALHVSLADAVLQTPLATVQIQSGQIIEQAYFDTTSAQREPVSELVLSLDRFYNARSLDCHGSAVHFSDAVLELTAQTWDQFPKCSFPKKISAKMAGQTSLRVEVRTEEVACSDAR